MLRLLVLSAVVLSAFGAPRMPGPIMSMRGSVPTFAVVLPEEECNKECESICCKNGGGDACVTACGCSPPCPKPEMLPEAEELPGCYKECEDICCKNGGGDACITACGCTPPCPKQEEEAEELLLAPLDDTTLYKVSGSPPECGQSTLDSKYAPYAEKFAGLKAGTCAAQGYTVPDGSQTIKVPVLGDVTVAKFKKAAAEPLAAQAAVDSTFLAAMLGSTGGCKKPGACGLTYSGCCFGAGHSGEACKCKLVDGSGNVSSDCAGTDKAGACGVAYTACCIGYKAKGDPCTCDVQDA